MAPVLGESPELLIEGPVAEDEISRETKNDPDDKDSSSSSLQEHEFDTSPPPVRQNASVRSVWRTKRAFRCSPDNCSHSFCYDCTTTHTAAKIHDRVTEIPCLALNCKAPLNSTICRLLIPDDILVKWDELLCLALIKDSHKVYCPFLDCSAMLVNESQEVIREIKCMACKRSFCAKCGVPWHSEFTCKEFEDHYGKKCRKGDKIVKMLAKKKKWQKCPKCSMYVEKSAGCVHIVCRCEYEFCYRCGAKWSRCLGTCRHRS